MEELDRFACSLLLRAQVDLGAAAEHWLDVLLVPVLQSLAHRERWRTWRSRCFTEAYGFRAQSRASALLLENVARSVLQRSLLLQSAEQSKRLSLEKVARRVFR